MNTYQTIYNLVVSVWWMNIYAWRIRKMKTFQPGFEETTFKVFYSRAINVSRFKDFYFLEQIWENKYTVNKAGHKLSKGQLVHLRWITNVDWENGLEWGKNDWCFAFCILTAIAIKLKINVICIYLYRKRKSIKINALILLCI